MGRTKYVLLLAFSLSLAAVLIFPWPALCDDYVDRFVATLGRAMGEFFFLMFVSLPIVEVLVVIAEAYIMRWMLRLPTRTAFLWSLLANLASLLLGSSLLFLLMAHLPRIWDSVFSLILVSILIAIAFEYLVLAILNRNRTTKASVLLYCILINIITVPLVYLAQHMIDRLLPLISRPVLDVLGAVFCWAYVVIAGVLVLWFCHVKLAPRLIRRFGVARYRLGLGAALGGIALLVLLNHGVDQYLHRVKQAKFEQTVGVDYLKHTVEYRIERGMKQYSVVFAVEPEHPDEYWQECTYTLNYTSLYPAEVKSGTCSRQGPGEIRADDLKPGKYQFTLLVFVKGYTGNECMWSWFGVLDVPDAGR